MTDKRRNPKNTQHPSPPSLLKKVSCQFLSLFISLSSFISSSLFFCVSDNEEKQTASQTSLCVASKVGSEGNLMQYAHGVGVDSHNDASFADQYSDPGVGPGPESQDSLGASSPVTSVTATSVSPCLPSSEVLA